jgi:hypothetical protein
MQEDSPALADCMGGQVQLTKPPTLNFFLSKTFLLRFFSLFCSFKKAAYNPGVTSLKRGAKLALKDAPVVQSLKLFQSFSAVHLYRISVRSLPFPSFFTVDYYSKQLVRKASNY